MFDFSDLVDMIPRGMKGRALMEFAIWKGYVKNPDTMRDYYKSNQAVIEGWVEQTDAEAIIDDVS